MITATAAVARMGVRAHPMKTFLQLIQCYTIMRYVQNTIFEGNKHSRGQHFASFSLLVLFSFRSKARTWTKSSSGWLRLLITWTR